MKKINLIGFFLFSLILISCGGETATNEGEADATTEEVATDDMKGMMMANLNEYDINASIYIPDESKGKAEFNATDWGSLEISVGKRYGVEIVPFGMTIEEKKEELAGDLVYTIEYIKDEADCIVYKKSIADSEVEAEVHFFLNIDLGGDVYEVKSLNDQAYNEKSIEKMISSAKTLTASNPS